jgi:hypothetical protein
MLNAAVARERDLGVPLPHARESIDRVGYQRVPASFDILDRDGVVAQPSDESVMLGGSARSAAGERDSADKESLHETQIQTPMRVAQPSAESDL